MNPTDDHFDDEGLDAALSQLPRSVTPSDGYADRVVSALRDRGLVRQARQRTPRMLVAAAWFLAGVGTGAAALSMLQHDRSDARPIIAVSTVPAEPVQWY